LRGNEGSEGEFLCCAFGAEKRERVEKREREREREKREKREGEMLFFFFFEIAVFPVSFAPSCLSRHGKASCVSRRGLLRKCAKKRKKMRLSFPFFFDFTRFFFHLSFSFSIPFSTLSHSVPSNKTT
jgi:hypothetical protein